MISKHYISHLIKLGLREHTAIQLGQPEIHFSTLYPSFQNVIVIITWMTKGVKSTIIVDYKG